MTHRRAEAEVLRNMMADESDQGHKTHHARANKKQKRGSRRRPKSHQRQSQQQRADEKLACSRDGGAGRECARGSGQ